MHVAGTGRVAGRFASSAERALSARRPVEDELAESVYGRQVDFFLGLNEAQIPR
jgi:hypothetical protein